MRKGFVVLVVGLVMALAIVPVTSSAKEKIFMGMSNWIGYAPLYLAQEKGFYAKRGLDVRVKIIESVADRRNAFKAGRLQAMATTVDTHVMSAAMGIPLKQVLALDDSYGGDGIVCLKEIDSFQALKGRKVAVHLGGGASLFWFNYVLRQHGMKLSDVKAVDMKAGDAGAAFIAKKVDAAVTWEPWLSRAKAAPFGRVLLTSRETPGVIVDSLAFRPDFIEKNPDAIRKIIQAWYEALEFSKANPKEAYAIMSKFTNQTPEGFAATLKDVRLYGPKENVAYFGSPEKPGLLYQVSKRASDFWLELNYIKRPVDPKRVIDGSFLK